MCRADSSQQYVWVRKAGKLSRRFESSRRFVRTRCAQAGRFYFFGPAPTRSIETRLVTHTMIYLGREKERKKPIMVGASDGRTYDGKQRFGVSVFDFQIAAAAEQQRRQTQSGLCRVRPDSRLERRMNSIAHP